VDKTVNMNNCQWLIRKRIMISKHHPFFQERKEWIDKKPEGPTKKKGVLHMFHIFVVVTTKPSAGIKSP